MTTNESASAPPERHWQGDALERHLYAEFLTNFLVSQVTVSRPDRLVPYCLSLDAEWGAGKTFFVDGWVRYLQTATAYPAFKFDAWATDFQSDPLIAFVSAFRKALHEEIDKAGLIEAKSFQVKSLISRGASALASAAVPLLKDVAVAAAKSMAPGALQAVKTAWDGGGNANSSVDLNELGADAVEGAQTGAAKYFEKALKDQEKKSELLRTFREAVGSALKMLQTDGNRQMPFFVFVDELDRCRPPYAIEMLENIKHVFNIPGLCFVVSTNMNQLANATGAIYGSKFNGRDYLQRFFDLDCTLPAPSGGKFVAMLVDEFPRLKERPMALGFPVHGFADSNGEPSIVNTILWVSSSFVLDLRSQRRMVMMLNACIASLPAQRPVTVLWLCVLCAARIKSATMFELLGKKGSGEWQTEWKDVVPGDQPRKYKTGRYRNVNDRTVEVKEAALQIAVAHYAANQFHSVGEFSDLLEKNKPENSVYPSTLSVEIWDATVHGRSSFSKQERMIYSDYADLVKLAGHVLG